MHWSILLLSDTKLSEFLLFQGRNLLALLLLRNSLCWTSSSLCQLWLQIQETLRFHQFYNFFVLFFNVPFLFLAFILLNVQENLLCVAFILQFTKLKDEVLNLIFLWISIELLLCLDYLNFFLFVLVIIESPKILGFHYKHYFSRERKKENMF